MAKKKYYVVKTGKICGIFENWADCQSSINGYPNAEHKSFFTLEEATAYLAGENIYEAQVKNDVTNGYVVAYTDGSYNDETDEYAYGVCILDLELNETNLCCKMNNSKFSPSRNIAGEIFGVLTALDWAVSNGYTKIRIYHDLEGISKWASGEFLADSFVSRYYVDTLNKRFKGYIEYEFVKVTGHSNNPYNEKADRLAASAFAGERKMISGANSFSVNRFSKSDLETIIHLIEEDNPDIIDERKNILGGEQIKLGCGKKNYTTIKIYDNQKLLVQGTPNAIYQMVLTYISELLGKDNVVTLVKQAYRLKIDSQALESNYANLCPRLPETYNSNIITLIKQAIINLNSYFEAVEYGQYAYPALRALEGHIKYLLNLNSIHTDKMFRIFSGDEVNGFTCCGHTPISEPDKTNIEKCYNYYHKNRHKVFHFGDIVGSTDNTFMLLGKSEVDSIIKETLALINDTVH